MYKELLEKIVKTEILEKGSRQRRMKFNPKNVSEKERDMVEEWTSPAMNLREEKEKQTTRQNIPKMDLNALKRGLHKIHKDTQVRLHPKTGERMFLLHRGMDDEEHGKLSGNNFLKDYTSSWTPHHDEARGMGYSNTVSAWIPESQIKSIPNAIGQKSYDGKIGESDYRSEKEIIVNPHQLITSKLKEGDSKQQLGSEMEQMAQPTKMAASEVAFSEEEALNALKFFVMAKMEESDYTLEELEKGWRQALKTGVSILGLIHGAHYIGQPNMDQKQPQAKERSVESISRKPELTAPAIEETQEEVLDDIPPESLKNKNISNFLKAISMNESSGGKNLKHKQMKGGIHSGDSAVGQYGLMPNTIKETVGRMGKGHPLYKQYRNMDNSEISTNMAQNPDHEHEIANYMANRLHDKHSGDESRMAYAWNQGSNLTNNHFETSHADYENHDYVQKYHANKEENTRNSNKSRQPSDISQN